MANSRYLKKIENKNHHFSATVQAIRAKYGSVMHMLILKLISR